MDRMKQAEEKYLKLHESYDSALLKSRDELAELAQEIAEQEIHVKELYREYVLSNVSLEAYQHEENLLKEKKELVKVVEGKIANIDTLKAEEMNKFYQDNKELFSEYNVAVRKMEAKQRKAIDEAKKAYLDVITKESVPVRTAQAFSHRFIGDLEVEGKIKDYNYRAGYSMYHILPDATFGGGGVDVSVEEIQKAYLKKVQ